MSIAKAVYRVQEPEPPPTPRAPIGCHPLSTKQRSENGATPATHRYSELIAGASARNFALRGLVIVVNPARTRELRA